MRCVSRPSIKCKCVWSNLSRVFNAELFTEYLIEYLSDDVTQHQSECQESRVNDIKLYISYVNVENV